MCVEAPLPASLAPLPAVALGLPEPVVPPDALPVPDADCAQAAPAPRADTSNAIKSLCMLFSKVVAMLWKAP